MWFVSTSRTLVTLILKLLLALFACVGVFFPCSGFVEYDVEGLFSEV